MTSAIHVSNAYGLLFVQNGCRDQFPGLLQLVFIFHPTCYHAIWKHFITILYYCFDLLSSENTDTSFIIAGDFNPVSNGFQSRFLINHCNLTLVVKQPTRGLNILDLIFTNISCFFEDPRTLAPLSSSDHNVIEWKSNIQMARKNKIRKIRVRRLGQSLLDRFYRKWSPVITAVGVDEKAETFLDTTKDIIDWQFFSTKNN